MLIGIRRGVYALLMREPNEISPSVFTCMHTTHSAATSSGIISLVRPGTACAQWKQGWLLLIGNNCCNTNLHPHRFEVIADYWSNLRFWGPLWGLGATYDVHLRLIGKLIDDFLLVMIELFSLGVFVLSQYTCLTDRQTSPAIPCVYASHSRTAMKEKQIVSATVKPRNFPSFRLLRHCCVDI